MVREKGKLHDTYAGSEKPLYQLKTLQVNFTF
jgi:hypothetical protein